MAETVNIFDKTSLLEVSAVLDGSGNYYSSYIATNDVTKIRVGVYSATGPVTIQQSLSSSSDLFVAPPTSVSTVSGAGQQDVDLVGRYFRLRVDSGTPSTTVRISIRKVG